jgi:DNA-binding XRE family transcriptional regulator
MEGETMNNVRAAREHYNQKNPNQPITQAGVARRLKISRQAYAKYESGQTKPDVYTGIRLGRILKTKVDVLFPVPK